MTEPHRYAITEPGRVPLAGLLLAYVATLPVIAGAVGVWVLPPGSGGVVGGLALTWAGAIVTFLAGVRRGLSFRAPDGATVPQIVTMLWLFGLGVSALALGSRPLATVLDLAGYLGLGLFDPLAAHREEAPPYFARLRPPQTAVFIVALLAILGRQVT